MCSMCVCVCYVFWPLRSITIEISLKVKVDFAVTHAPPYICRTCVGKLRK